ncbi:XRE family transcriptional regulator [Rhodococcus gordoniae]|uniref:XRE family transcriptional regulator n=1 Tax=Rhodococcus gordoniae TaxID=223392 RepID=A0A379LUE8_9NOCA|nr:MULTISPECIES: helix-turn-helix transcriptional regulator [Rhodococcus]UTT50253.1 helix-turn-helix transcriptional regulator [Rhodococcus gordoniae]SUE13674.1 XRE family transcriptional regulator [Rhodococcus gordoniae]
MALLLREALGDSLRRTRVSQSRTLREVSSSARVSLGYLSEIERGRKEASSELLAAICDALDVPLSDVLFDVSGLLADGLDRRAGMESTASETISADRPDGPEPGLLAQEPRMVIPAPAAQALAAA